jgi:hypothetical protein
MSTETKSNVASSEHNRIVASGWIDAFNARDAAAEVAARTADYIAHAPESIEPAALDSDAWVEFLRVATAPGLAGHEAVGEAAHGPVIGTTFRVAGQSQAPAESPATSHMSHRLQPAVSIGT